MVCVFFGHRDAPDSIRPALEEKLRELIDKDPHISFYVGCRGNFDRMVISLLKKLSAEYPYISCTAVISSVPSKKDGADKIYCGLPTVLPECAASAPPKYALDRCSKWMCDCADTVICYVSRSSGGAAKAVSYALKKKKAVINLYK